MSTPMLWKGSPLMRNGTPAMGYPCCCGFKCELFTDAFDRVDVGDDWSVNSGSWSISSGKLTSSSANGKISIVGTAQRMSSMSHSIVITVTIYGDANALLRVYTSSSDYVEFVCDADGDIAEANINGGDNYPISTPASSATFTICHLEDDWLIVSGIVEDAATTSPSADGVSFGYGTTAGGSFDDIAVEHHYSVNDKCPDCGAGSCSDCSGPGVIYYELEVRGVGGGLGGDPCPACSAAQCDATWNTNFILSPGNSSCSWIYWFNGGCTTCNTDGYVSLSITSTYWYVELQNSAQFSPFLATGFRRTTIVPCKTDGWITIPVENTRSVICDGTNVTLRLRSL